MLLRAPSPALAPFVARMWASDAEPSPTARELVLPSGAMHLVLRLDEPLRVFDAPEGGRGHTVGHAVLGGARAAAYVRDVSRPNRSVGVQLRPGAAALLGVSARELAGAHTPLDALWGAAARELMARVRETPDPARRLALVERALLARAREAGPRDDGVDHALRRLARGDAVAAVVDDAGCSHRRFIARFVDAVGLTPKVYSRVRRARRALSLLGAHPLAEVAVRAGYSDQAHLSRELRAIAGITPREYLLRDAPGAHVPIPGR